VIAYDGLTVSGLVTAKDDLNVIGNISGANVYVADGGTVDTDFANIGYAEITDISGVNFHTQNGTLDSAYISGAIISGLIAAEAEITSGIVEQLYTSEIFGLNGVSGHAISDTSGALVTETDVWTAVDAFSGLLDTFLVNMRAEIHQELWDTVEMLLEPPAAIQNLTIAQAAMNSRTINFSWDNPDDIDLKEIIIYSPDAYLTVGGITSAFPVSGWVVPQDKLTSGGAHIEFSIENFAWTTAPEGDSQYNFELKAYDRSNNVSPGVALSSVKVKENISLKARPSIAVLPNGSIRIKWYERDENDIENTVLTRSDSVVIDTTTPLTDSDGLGTYKYVIDDTGLIGSSYTYKVTTSGGGLTMESNSYLTLPVPDYLTPTSWNATINRDANGNIFNQITYNVNTTVDNHALITSAQLFRNGVKIKDLNLSSNDTYKDESIVGGTSYTYRIDLVGKGTNTYLNTKSITSAAAPNWTLTVTNVTNTTATLVKNDIILRINIPTADDVIENSENKSAHVLKYLTITDELNHSDADVRIYTVEADARNKSSNNLLQPDNEIGNSVTPLWVRFTPTQYGNVQNIKYTIINDSGLKNTVVVPVNIPLKRQFVTFSFFSDAAGTLATDGSITPKWATSGVPLQYSLNEGSTWINATSGSAINSNNGKNILMSGTGRNSLFIETDPNNWWSLSTYTKCDGNLNTLLNYATPPTTIGSMCFCGMFYNCTKLIKAPELPATTLVTECYRHMFTGCTAITTLTAYADIPATWK
jgi:hypothetical protein